MPRLVTLDVMMPFVNGFDVLRGLKGGETEYPTKPFKPGELMARVRRLIGGHGVVPGAQCVSRVRSGLRGGSPEPRLAGLDRCGAALQGRAGSAQGAARPADAVVALRSRRHHGCGRRVLVARRGRQGVRRGELQPDAPRSGGELGAGRLGPRLDGGWGTQLGVRQVHYAATDVTLGELTLERYVGNFRAAYSFGPLRSSTAGGAHGHRLQGGYIVLLLTLLLGVINTTTFLLFALATLNFGLLLSTLALVVDALSFQILARPRDVFMVARHRDLPLADGPAGALG